MSEALLNWLNATLSISPPVTKIESDFADGYSFGEVLLKTKVISSKDHYIKSPQDNFDINKNFSSLKKDLQHINLYLTEDTINDIKTQRKNKAAMFLYRIRTYIERKEMDLHGIMSRSNAFKSENRHLFPIETDHSSYSPFTTTMASVSNTVQRGKIKLEPIAAVNVPSVTSTEMFKHSLPVKKKTTVFSPILENDEHCDDNNNNNNNTHQEKATFTSNNKVDDINFNDLTTEQSPQSNGYIKKNIHRLYRDTNDYCSYMSLDNNLNKIGIEIKAIDPKIKRYGYGDDNNFIPTDIVLKKVNDIALAEKRRIEEEKLKKKIPSEEERLFKQSIIFKYTNRGNLNNDDNKINEIVSNTVNFNNKSKIFKQMQYEIKRKNIVKINTQKRKRQINFFTFHNTLSSPTSFGYSSMNTVNTLGITAPVFDDRTFFNSLHKETLPQRCMQISTNQKRKVEDTPLIRNVVELILDLTDECYLYQSEQHKSLIELPGWIEWMQLFINGTSCSRNKGGYKQFLNEPTPTQHDQEQQDITKDSDINNDDLKLLMQNDYCCNEYFDYLNYRGNWNASVIPKSALNTQVRVYDVLGHEIGTLLSSGKLILQGVKSSLLKTLSNEGFEMKNEEKENVVIPKENIRNQLVGEMLEINFDNSYKETQPQNNNILSLTPAYSFEHIPIKICLIGHAFSGRKTQGQLIHEKYPEIKVYCVSDIIKSKMDIYEQIVTPVEEHPKYKSMKKNQIEQLQKEKDDLKETLGDSIFNMLTPLYNKEIPELPDEHKIQLLLDQIKSDFPVVDNKELIDAITKKHQRKTEIETELEKIAEEQSKKAKNKAKEESALRAELEKLNVEGYKGFICVDFPTTYQQYTLLVNMATGYTQQIDKPINTRNEQKYELTFNLDKHYPNHNVPFPLSNQSIFTSSVETVPSKQCMFDMFIWLEVNESETLRRVNNRKLDPSTGVVYHLEDNPPPENDKKLKERLVDVTEPSIESIKTDLQSFDETFPQIIDFLALFKNTSKISKQHVADINNEINSIIATVLKNFEDIENKDFITDIDKNAQMGMDIDDNETTKYFKRLNETKKKVSPLSSEKIVLQWNAFSFKYESTIKKIISFLHKQKTDICNQMTIIQNEFKSFLNLPSNKSELIQIFKSKYLSFKAEFPFLKHNHSVKNEFLRDLEELTGHLWEVIRMKKTDAINERTLIIQSGFIEKQINVFYQKLETLFLIETEKLYTTLNLIREFYYHFEPNKQQESNPYNIKVNSLKILNDVSSLAVLSNDKKTSPKIEQIYRNCFKLFFEYDKAINEIDTNLKAQAASNALNISGVSTVSHRRKRNAALRDSNKVEQSLFSETKDVLSYEDELKAAVNNEKNKFKYRITFLKFFGVAFINELYDIINKTFDNLDTWIIDSIKLQNDAMNELIANFKEQIENGESEIRFDIELDKFDVFSNIELQFKNVEPPCSCDLPSDKKKIDYTELYKCYLDLKSYEIQNNYVTYNDVMDILIRKNILEKRCNGLSKILKEMPFANWSSFLSKIVILSSKGVKLVKLTHLFIFLGSMHMKLMSEYEESEIIRSVESKFKFHCFLDRNDYVKVKLWFEEDEEGDSVQVDKEGYREFVFNICKNVNNEINFLEYVNVLMGKYLQRDSDDLSGNSSNNDNNSKGNVITYFDMLIN